MISLSNLKFPSCPSCNKQEGQEHVSTCPYSGCRMPDDVREKHAAARDVFVTSKKAYELLADLYIRLGARVPNHVHMAMCYLQIEVTQSTKPRHYVAMPSSAATP